MSSLCNSVLSTTIFMLKTTSSKVIGGKWPQQSVARVTKAMTFFLQF